MSAGKATQLKKLLDQVLDRPNRGEVLLDLLLTNTEEIIEEVKIGGSLAVVIVPWLNSQSIGIWFWHRAES